jgi:histidine triad (HIT) family protein
MLATVDCIFCAIVEGAHPAERVAETERALAFMDINPATRGHALVIPKEHAADLLSLPAADLAACAILAQEVAGRAIDRLGADGVNVVNACGAAAWQSVYHFHFHVVPRYAGRDGLHLPWIPTPGDPAEIGETAALLR